MQLGRARVHHAEQHTLAGLNANRLACAQYFPVNGSELVLDVERAVFRERRLPFVEKDRNFLIVAAGLIPGIDDHHPELARVRSAAQIAARHNAAVVPKRSCRTRSESVTAAR